MKGDTSLKRADQGPKARQKYVEGKVVTEDSSGNKCNSKLCFISYN